jgi:hypothetical protein
MTRSGLTGSFWPTRDRELATLMTLHLYLICADVPSFEFE